jgi:hypothetical protein
MKRFVLTALLGLAWVLGAYLVWGISVRHRYLGAFEITRPGDSMSTVLTRFSPPSHIDPRGRYNGSDNYWIRFWYEMPFSLGVSPVTLDFDSNQLTASGSRRHKDGRR